MFCQSNLLFGRSDGKIRGRKAKFRAPEFFFRGSEFLFRGSYEKIPVQKRFHGGSGAVFLSRWNFFPNTFSVSFCRRNPPAGFPAGRTSAPGVSRVPSKRQVGRGFRDILISAWRVWLRFFRAVPARRPNTRISEGENEQIVNAHPEVSFCQSRRCGIPAAQSQDMTQTYGIVRVCYEGVPKKTPPPCRGGGAKRRRGLTSTKTYFMCVSVGVKPLRPVGPAPLQGGAVVSRRFCYTLVIAVGLLSRLRVFMNVYRAFLAFHWSYCSSTFSGARLYQL